MSDFKCEGCGKLFSTNALLSRHHKGKANLCLQSINDKKHLILLDKEYIEKSVYNETIAKLNDDILELRNEIKELQTFIIKHQSHISQIVINENAIMLNPTTYESLSHITVDELCDILASSKNALTKLIHYIYSIPENMNFTKDNINSDQIKYIDTYCDTSYIQEDEFINTFYKTLITQLLYIIYIHSEEFDKDYTIKLLVKYYTIKNHYESNRNAVNSIIQSTIYKFSRNKKILDNFEKYNKKLEYDEVFKSNCKNNITQKKELEKKIKLEIKKVPSYLSSKFTQDLDSYNLETVIKQLNDDSTFNTCKRIAEYKYEYS